MDIVRLGAAVLREGVALWQGIVPITDDPGDDESLGDGDVFQGLGLSSLPYPGDENGFAEGIAVRGLSGRILSWFGARDTRSAKILGNLKPGDTVLHSTGPQQAAQFQCKENKRQAVAATKDPNGKTMVFMLDGTANKAQIVLSGMIFEMDGKEKSFTITNGQASILMQGSTIALDGDVILGGKVGDPVNKIVVSAAVTPAPLPCATAPAPGIPVSAARGVSVAV